MAAAVNAVDWQQTDRRVITYLTDKKRPVKYTALFEADVMRYLPNASYGDKTHPVEKLRQRYGNERDRPHPAIVTLPEGFVALRRWFASMAQLQLTAPTELEAIEGDFVIAYEAGFEAGMRLPHMINYKGDHNTPRGRKRLQEAFLVQQHVAEYFRTHYPGFYRAPSNEGKYEQPAVDDFRLVLPNGVTYIVDIKSWTDDGEDGQGRGLIPGPRDHIIYIWGEWQEENGRHRIVMTGYQDGHTAKALGTRKQYGNRIVYEINGRSVYSIEQFLVMLNIARDHPAKSNDYDSWRAWYQDTHERVSA